MGVGEEIRGKTERERGGGGERDKGEDREGRGGGERDKGEREKTEREVGVGREIRG